MQCYLTVKYLKNLVSIENLDDASVIENHTNSGILTGYKFLTYPQNWNSREKCISYEIYF